MIFALKIKKPALFKFFKTYNLRIEKINDNQAKRIPRKKFINTIRIFLKKFT
jgi:hypothetical protein